MDNELVYKPKDPLEDDIKEPYKLNQEDKNFKKTTKKTLKVVDKLSNINLSMSKFFNTKKSRNGSRHRFKSNMHPKNYLTNSKNNIENDYNQSYMVII